VTKHESIGARALRFLDTHGLSHDPEHYDFAFRYLSGTDRAFSDAVDHEIEGGVRLREEAVQTLMPADPIHLAGQAFDQLSNQLLELLRSAASATGELNRDLVRTAAALVSAEPPRTRKLVVFLIEKTAEAEESLAVTLRQAQALRSSLNGAREGVDTDSVTGLPNSVSMAQRLEASTSAAGNCSIAVIAIDQLAELCSEHGVMMGDRVLKAAALTLQEACSPYQVGRWDNGTFMALVDEPSIATGIEKLEAACADMASRHLKMRENDELLGRVTFSVGLATSRGRSAAEVVKAADRLLRKAKEQGGDRVVAESKLIDISTG
jgi:diguanylate cyclase